MTSAERQRKWRKSHPAAVLAQKRRSYANDKIGARDRNLRKNYGITYTQLEEMHAHQGGVCAICARAIQVEPGTQRDAAHVDHDHATGEVRGLLCNFCNRGLGYYEDDPGRLLAAAAYLSR
jgi:hypothetical protein